MKINSIEFELRRFELSQSNDKINYEKHSYNGFLGIEGRDAYFKYLEGLYNNYFVDLRMKIDNLIINNNNDLLLKFLKDRINLFNDIKNDFELKSTPDFWNSYIIRCQTVDAPILQRSQAARNEYGTVKFFIEMIGTQFYFIEKAINDLNLLHNTYDEVKEKSNRQNTSQKLQQNRASHIDEYFEKHFANKDITNKEIALMFDITRPTIQEWREQGKIIMISEQGKRPIIYSKEKLIEDLKDGTIKDRLKNIVQNGSK